MALLLRDTYSVVLSSIYSENRFPELERQGVRVVSLNKKTGKLYNIPSFFKFLRLIRREKPSVIHSFLMFGNLYACGAAFLLGFKNVITSTRINIDVTRRYGGNRFTYSLFRKFSRFHMINTQYNKDWLIKEMGYGRTQLSLIENVVDTDRFFDTSKNIKAPGAVYPARIEKRKNQLVLIRAMNILKQEGLLLEGFKILLVGEKNDRPYAEEVFKAVREYNLEKSIIFIDPIADIERYYSMYSFLVFPSSWEGLSNTILEGMSSGLPVVCSLEANMPGLIDEGINGFLFPSHDPEACAESLSKMINTDALKRKEMSQINRKRIEKRFTRPIVKKKLEALYESCM